LTTSLTAICTEVIHPTHVIGVYVTDFDNARVVKLAAGSNTQMVLPFTGLDAPLGVAVDGVGDLYVTYPFNKRVLKLAAGSNTPTVPPFTSLNNPRYLAVDRASGAVYVTDPGQRVVKLPAQ
jgi:serine/threonine protein kinase, bacterial